jgi:GGDEF domain-containing protein
VEESKNGITHVTISVGFAPYKDDYMEAIKHADQALFFVKENGRNAVGDYEVLCQRGVVGDDEVVEPLEPG